MHQAEMMEIPKDLAIIKPEAGFAELSGGARWSNFNVTSSMINLYLGFSEYLAT